MKVTTTTPLKFKKRDTLHLRIPHTDKMRLKALAKEQGVTLSVMCYNELTKLLKK